MNSTCLVKTIILIKKKNNNNKERAVSMYYYIKSDPGLNKQIGDTIDRYAKSEYVENNCKNLSM